MTLAAVILAAGEGRRAGSYKPLTYLGGRTAIDRVIDAASSRCDRIVVVGGACFEQLRRHLGERQEEIELRHNAAWSTGGMFSSVQLGLAGVSSAAFVHPADIPGPGPGVYHRLADELAAHPVAVLRPAHADRPGHPVLLAPEAIARVTAAAHEQTLRDVLAQLPRRDVPVDDELIGWDFDTAEDFTALEQRIAAREREE